MIERIVIGLADNPDNIGFHCGTCNHFKTGFCLNKNPRLHGRRVEPDWCCNLYDHAGMQFIIK